VRSIKKIPETSLVVLFVFLAAVAGCQTPEKRTTATRTPVIDKMPTFYEDIVHVTLMVNQPYIDVDADGHPDGIRIRLLLLRSNQPEFVAGKGRVIVYLMQKVKSPQGQFVPVELYKWTLDQDTVTQSVVRQGLGIICHQMALYWGNLTPHGGGIELQAKFIRTDQKELSSYPIPMAFKD
jgi:hypothetical protein